ncbi:MAG: alpha-beta hydrolase superfamily lysophospholipase [Cyclobacteriaceae bacterium]|jgi:alpha-beta hydrolase superfamily lysophospholipase
MDVESEFITGQDGLKLHYKSWIPENPLKILCIIHGHGEHSGRYAHVATSLNEQNIAVFALDLRGHGLSKGKRGHTPSYEMLLKDIEEFLKTAREHFNDLPLYLMGHSMGGNLVANFMIENTSREISGFILSSPWFKLAFDPPQIKLKLGRLMTRIWPSYSEHNGLEIKHISKDPIEVQKYADDPKVHGMISAGLFDAIAKGAERALINASKITITGLVYHGSADQIIDYHVTESFANSNNHIEWHLLEGVYHEPHNDVEKTDVLKMLSSWILKN